MKAFLSEQKRHFQIWRRAQNGTSLLKQCIAAPHSAVMQVVSPIAPTVCVTLLPAGSTGSEEVIPLCAFSMVSYPDEHE